MKLYVSNLSVRVTENDLEMLFERFGKVVSVDITADDQPGPPVNTATITMQSDEECYDAANALNHKIVDRHLIRVLIINERRTSLS
jgi:RNA recognition motif-containing protein